MGILMALVKEMSKKWIASPCFHGGAPNSSLRRAEGDKAIQNFIPLEGKMVLR